MSNRENYVKDKVVIITGASNGFGALTAERVAELGGKPVLAARNEDKLKAVVEKIKAAGGEAAYIVTDVSNEEQVFAMAKFAVDTYGRIDVLVNNAGNMPLGFFADYKKGMKAWTNCIDISIKGTLYGICAVYDQMMAQGQGQVINISSIYANYPLAGAAVYQVAKVGVEYLAESLRSECQGKIKVTTIKPTGFNRTGLIKTVVDDMAGASIVSDLMGIVDRTENAMCRPDFHDIDSITYNDPDPQILADNIVYAIDQPWGVSVANITVRASGDGFAI
ncbi:MAG: SDR family oxidoreductase [Oscillospiraceae bacterium]